VVAAGGGGCSNRPLARERGAIMDEDDMRAMLGRLADAEGPPPRIDVRQAIVRGRRGRRLRTMTTPPGPGGPSWKWLRLGAR
jgi:hypothetical protein